MRVLHIGNFVVMCAIATTSSDNRRGQRAIYITRKSPTVTPKGLVGAALDTALPLTNTFTDLQTHVYMALRP